MQEGTNYNDDIVLTTIDALKTEKKKLRRLNNQFQVKHEGQRAPWQHLNSTLSPAAGEQRS